MKILNTDFEGLFIIEPELLTDMRGYFARIFGVDELKKEGLKFNIVQINRSLTVQKGTIRGMHFQKKPKAEGKIIQCLKGKVFDVVIDMRKDSATLGEHFSIELSEENNKMLYVPKGFAHGFQTLTDNCEMLYLMSEFYSPEQASGLRWNDPYFKIDWPLKPTFISDKDNNWPLYK